MAPNELKFIIRDSEFNIIKLALKLYYHNEKLLKVLWFLRRVL